MEKFTKLLLNIVFFFLINPSYGLGFKVFSHNLEYAFYKGNQLLWSFKIKEFVQKENDDFEGKSVYLINKKLGLEIWAEKVFYFKNEDKFLLKENVRLVTSSYGEVYTQELVFSPKKNLIFTDKEVIVKKKGFYIKGMGLIYDINTGNFKVKEKAKVQMKI